MINKLKAAVLVLPLLALFLTSGCDSQPAHPNQINAFDGATYDTLTVTHGALTSLRAQVAGSYPQYAPVFNQAAAAYATAFNAYSVYRATAGSQAEVSAAIANLTVSVVSLENTFLSDMHVSANNVISVEGKARTMRTRAGAALTISDILVELEIAAALAGTIPGAQPYALLAQIIINATSQAVAAEVAAAGQAIDLSTIQPVPAIA
ncbi:MAG TPA: hypothetical protein VK604_29065 [Bryobacteraceae bacterium]|nr:hypothetical protein [Bryobacteraceae bacterium]